MVMKRQIRQGQRETIPRDQTDGEVVVAAAAAETGFMEELVSRSTNGALLFRGKETYYAGKRAPE